MVSVRFNYADRRLSLSDKRWVRQFVEEIFEAEGIVLGHLDYIFCSDNYLLDINRRFLDHDYFTDIITFDLSEGKVLQGEVYISLDRVKSNAVGEGVSFKEEVLRVIFHGALHLCGYKDKTKSELTDMREREDHYLRLFEEKTNGK